jgi:hypothetical protein
MPSPSIANPNHTTGTDMADLATCSFLPFADLASAQARSKQMATSMRCDGTHTLYWHWQVELTDGTACMVIEPSGPYGTKPGPNALQGLTPNEIASLVPWSTVEPIWPQPPSSF